jgi:hypothetical protein
MELSSLWITRVLLIVVDNYLAEATNIKIAENNNALVSLSDHDYMSSTKSHNIPSRLLLLVDVKDDDDEQQDTDDSINGSITQYAVLGGEPLSIVDKYNNTDNNDGCDESKCVSTGLHWIFFNGSFTCYTDGGDWDPMMCADVYKPRIVENETIIKHPYHPYGRDPYYQYFTCCSPNLSSDADVSRHCSNSTTMNNGLGDPSNNAMICDDM